MKPSERDTVIIYFPDTGGHNFTPPYELLFQYEALKSLPVKVILVDHRTNDLKEILNQHHQTTLLVVISTIIKYTSITISKQYDDGILASEYIHVNYSLPVLWTGLAPTILDLLLSPFTDYILKANSERALLQLVKAFLERSTFDNIENLGYKNDDKMMIQNTVVPYDAFEHFGNFDLSVLDIRKYIHNQTFDYVATTGCINKCSFCTVPLIYSQKCFHNAIHVVANHLSTLTDKYKEIRIIHFRDDNFMAQKNFVFSLFELLQQKDVHFLWSAQTSINVLTTYKDEELIWLHQQGCTNISIGIESGDPYILKKVTKSKTDINKSIQSIKKLLQASISPSLTSIISFPYNNGRDFRKTLKVLMKIKLLYPKLSLYCTVFHPIPKTEIFNELFPSEALTIKSSDYNNWTTDKERLILKKFEQLYFTFCDRFFYKSLPHETGKKIRVLNILLYPFIRFRFFLGSTHFLWEYNIASKRLKAIQKEYGLPEDKESSCIGIRHLNTNYGYNVVKIDK